MDPINEAYKSSINEAASKGEIESLYIELYNFIGRFNITDLKNAGLAIGTQLERALEEKFNVASKTDKALFKEGVKKGIK